MRTHLALAGLVAGLIAPHAIVAQAPKLALSPAPSPVAVLVLADRYLADGEKKATIAERELIKAVKDRFRTIELDPDRIKETIADLVNVLTAALAGMKSANALTVASALLVKLDPNNPRVTNLFGSVLHSTNRLRDAVTVLELTAAQSPDGVLARLNLANAYFDVGLDTKAKVQVDKALRLEPENQQAWRTMATYWLRQKNIGEFQRALLRGSTFAGYVRRASDKADALADASEIKVDDDLAAMERKAAALWQSVPLSTADLVDVADPALAGVIRTRAGKLLPAERMALPLFPQINSSSNRGYTVGMPVVMEWIKTIAGEYSNALQADLMAKTGITTKDDSASAARKAIAYGNAEIAKTLGNAQDMLKYLKDADIPGVSKAQLNAALGQVNQVAAGRNITLSTAAVDPDRPPGFDYGAPFSKANYRNYLVVSRSLEAHLEKYFTKFDGEEKEFVRLYFDRAAKEQTVHANNVEALERSNPGSNGNSKADLQEKARFARAMNAVGDESFRRWANLYVPDYTKKMKPMLEQYWSTCILYVRNMHDLAVVSREYARVRSVYLQHTMKAAMYAADGAAFAYVAATDEELAALDAEIRLMEKEEAPKQGAVFKSAFKLHTLPPYDKPHEKDWVDFIGENLHYELKAQFISVKLTAQSIELDFWAFGPAAGIKFDFVDEKMETYVGLKAKWEIGIKVGGLDVSAGAEGEFSKMTSSWDFLNGKYSEGYPPPQGSVSVGASAGNFSLSGDAKYEAGKGASASAGAKGGFGPLNGSGEISYAQDAGFVAKSGASVGAGPLKASVNSTLDAQLNARSSASVGVSAQGFSTQKDLSLPHP